MRRGVRLLVILTGLGLLGCTGEGDPALLGPENWLTRPSGVDDRVGILFMKNHSNASGTMAEQRVKPESQVALAKCEFINPGTRFAGWATNQSGPTLYEDQQKIEIGKASLVLHARWSCQVVFEPENGQERWTTNLLLGDPYGALPEVSRDDEIYGFGGWWLGERSINSNTIVSDPDHTLRAKWLTNIKFTGLTATKSVDGATTELTLSFDQDPVGLTRDDILLTGAIKGALGGSGTTRTLKISGLTVGHGERVEVSISDLSAYKIIPRSRSVEVSDLFGGVEYRDLVSVPGGEYDQVSFAQEEDDRETFTHTVSDFEIAKYELSYELWHRVYTWATNKGYSFENPGREGSGGTDGALPTDKRHEPVTMITWWDALVWCNAYSEILGLDFVYFSDESLSSPLKAVALESYADWDAYGYRLPSEGEWQYAASYKGSTADNYASGATNDYNDAIATGAVAWYGDNSGGTTHKVGTKAPNALGIHDMSGNVAEWCWDRWSEGDREWPSVAQTDYRGLDSGSFRATRGGSYKAGSATALVVGSRGPGNVGPTYVSSTIGFRLARYGL